MVMRLLPLIVLILVNTSLFAQDPSTLDFPRVFSPTDLLTSGFAIVNPSNFAASVRFTLYGTDGSTIATSSQTIASGGQLALLGSQLFPTATSPGWVQATSTTAGLQGFWLGGDFTTFADGAAAAQSADDLVLPLVTNQTDISVANIGTDSILTVISLRSEIGIELDSSTVSIPAKGVFRSEASLMFPSIDLSQTAHLRITRVFGSAQIAATAVVSGFQVSPSWVVINATDATATTRELNFAHVISGSGGGGNWLTTVGVTNLTSSLNNLTITFTPSAGGGSPTSVERSIAANGGLRESAQSLFSFPTGQFQDGWVQVSSTAASTGFISYADRVSGSVAVVPVQETPDTSLLFAHIADLSPWLSGVAVLNTTGSRADVEVFAINPDGSLIGSANLTIASRSKQAVLLSTLIPETQARTSDGGFIFVRTTNGVPLYGVELFFTRNLTILANVTAATLESGITFTPPPRTVSFTFKNSLQIAVALTITGASTITDSVTALSEKTFTIGVRDDAFSVSYEGQQTTTQGTEIGVSVQDTQTITLNGDSSATFTASAPFSVFFLKVSTNQPISDIITNFRLPPQLSCNCSIPASGTFFIGYFTRGNNSNVVIVNNDDQQFVFGPRFPSATPELPGIRSDEVITVTFPGGVPIIQTLAVRITNHLIYSISVDVNGDSLGTVAAGATLEQSVAKPTGAISVNWSLNRPTLSGRALGDEMGGSFSVSASQASFSADVTNIVGDAWYFAPRITNNTSTPLLMEVNAGLLSENRCNCVVSANAVNVAFGYYRFFSNSNVRAYRADTGYSGEFVFWEDIEALSLSGGANLRADTAPSLPSGGGSSSGGGSTGGGSGVTGLSGSALCFALEGALIFADDGQFLGKITSNRFDVNSIGNQFGLYGSRFSVTSIFNEFGTYGSRFSILSPFNDFTFSPPLILINGTFVGFLTTNRFKFPGISPLAILPCIGRN